MWIWKSKGPESPASEAERIYLAWYKLSTAQLTGEDAIADGRFDKFIGDGGFDDLVESLLGALAHHHDFSVFAGVIWELIDLLVERHPIAVAQVALYTIERCPGLRNLLTLHPSWSLKALKLRNRPTVERIDPTNIYFEKTGHRVALVRPFGGGGSGGGVFLALSATGAYFCVKRLTPLVYEVPGHTRQTNRTKLDYVTGFLLRYIELSVTTTCIDYTLIGQEQFLLLELGEGLVDYCTLGVSDVLSVFDDLARLCDYSWNSMTTHITQDFGVLHLDIHGENLMRFGGRLRFIDFGQATPFALGQENLVQGARIIPYDRNNPDLYFQYDGLMEDRKRLYEMDSKAWSLLIANWERQPGNEHGGQLPLGVANPQQYGCVVLTAVLIKELWCAEEKRTNTDMGLGIGAARSIRNEDVYVLARAGMSRFETQAPARLIGQLLQWFDEMMRRLYAGEAFTPRDAVRFFGGRRTESYSRGRKRSLSF